MCNNTKSKYNNFGSMLCTILVKINWRKKWINCVKIKFIWMILYATWIELNSNIMNGIFKFHWIEFKVKWDANWCKRYWKFAYDYSVRKKKNSKKTNLKTLFHSSFLENQLKIVYFGVVQLTTYEISSCPTLTKFVESSSLKYI